jgi:hypothetical protein
VEEQTYSKPFRNRLDGPSMSALNELKPTQKLLVVDLLDEVGVDVSDWKNLRAMSRPTIQNIATTGHSRSPASSLSSVSGLRAIS